MNALAQVLATTRHVMPSSPIKLWYELTRDPAGRRYERRIMKRMARGELTNTLGVRIRDEAGIRADADRWLAELVKLGLRPGDLCVEYGCGSLWCAEPIIRHLQPGRFIGLDITDRFYEFGRQRLYSLLTEKRVGLGVISRRNLRQVAALQPDLVYSHRVLHHIPRQELARYVHRLQSLLSERTILVIENQRPPAPDGSLRGRRYGASDIQRYLTPNWICRQESFGLLVTYDANANR